MVDRWVGRSRFALLSACRPWLLEEQLPKGESFAREDSWPLTTDSPVLRFPPYPRITVIPRPPGLVTAIALVASTVGITSR